MGEQPPWHEDPAFWETFREYLFSPEKVAEATEQVDQVLALLDVEPGARVLDVPCGVGRHAAEFARRGYRVTGVDVTQAYLDAARDRAREVGEDEADGDDTVGQNVEFRQADMREFRRPGAFDAVVNVYTSFGYFEDRADDERTARNFYESLKPGGRLLLNLTSKEVLAGKFEKRTWNERDGAYVLEEHEVTDDWNWMENRWIVVEDGETKEFTVSHRLYSAYELSQLLKGVGFETVEVYGNLDGSTYDENAEGLVAVAEK
ncbi:MULTISPECIES: cyclopropane-fatty-acyl-phospholipid synthase family protein [Halorussus]|uniref:SAM-dependent methyltransferase n=1 Tax=Halorussus TaxID=1070314 RepID=UPI0013B3DAAA|nr:MULTISPECIES: class I SAM-dependent methyltransferase [Halorussus]NHN58041.1 class I SAM-dependent methyltransferase [Halorussus sp. JP-T4]